MNPVSHGPVGAIGYPDETKPLLSFQEGRFREAFVAFNPFLTMTGAPVAAEATHSVVRLSDEEIAADPIMSQLSSREVYATNPGCPGRAVIFRLGKAVPWVEIAEGCGFAGVDSVHLALRTLIGGLSAEARRPDLAERLRTHCEREGIVWPTEGAFGPLTWAALSRLFLSAGSTRVHVNDEHGDNCESMAVPEPTNFDALAATYARHWAPRFASHDASLVVTVHWDSFFFVVFGPSGLSKHAQALGLEGFAAAPHTTHQWDCGDASHQTDSVTRFRRNR